MTKIISARTDDSDISFLPELLTNASVKSLFWKPKFPSDETFSYYLPLLFWLVDATRPREAVQLGVGLGAAYLGLCQAVDKLDLGTSCYGYGPFLKGTDATPDVPAALQQTCDAHFDGIAVLAAATPASAANRFAEETIDLLIVDLSTDADLVTSLTLDFPARLSRSGVMVLHGTNRVADDGQLQAYLGRLRAGGRVIEFDWGDGVMLVMVGAEPSARMARLTEQLRPGSPSRQVAMTILRRLGSAHYLGARVDNLTAREAVARRAAATSRKDLETLRARHDEVSAAYDVRSNKIADLQVHLFDAQQLSLQASASETAARTALAFAEARITSLEQDVATSRQTLAQARQHSDDLKTRHATLLDRVRVEAEAALDAKAKEATALSAEFSALASALADARAEANADLIAKTKDAERLASKVRDLEAAHAKALAEAEAAADAKADEADALASKLITLEAAHAKALAEAEAVIDAKADEADALAVERGALETALSAARAEAEATITAKIAEADALAAERDASITALALAQTGSDRRNHELAALTLHFESVTAAAQTALQAKAQDISDIAAQLATAEKTQGGLAKQLAQAEQRAIAAQEMASTLTAQALVVEKAMELRLQETVQLKQAMEAKGHALQADLAAKLTRADAQIAVRTAEQATAVARIAALEEDLRASSRAADEMASFINQQDKETQRVRRDAAALEKQVVNVRNSRSWRILEPVRMVSRLLTGRKRPAPFVPTYLEAPRLDRAGRLAQIMPALKRELRRPGSLSQETLVRFLRYQLWGGAHNSALPRLESMLASPDISHIARLRACSSLSTWYDYNGDRDRALSVLDAVANAPSEFSLSKDRIIRQAVLLAAMGKRDEAVSAIESLSEPASRLSDTLLVRANLADDDGARLTLMNRMFERSGFAPLRFKDPDSPLTLGNIETVEVDAQIEDQGLVSVIMPAFNSAGTIETALRSLFAQSYRNLEVVVVDDRSTDDTAKIVAGMATSEPRLKLIVQDKNAGAYPARNRGLAVAQGAFLTTHDADDWSHPQKIEEQLRALAEAPRKMAAITHWVRVRPPLVFTTNWRLSDDVIHWSHSSLLFRREVFDRLGGWDNVRVSADTEFIWRIEAVYGKRAVVKLHKDVPLAFALDDDTSLTRTKLTHVSTSYYGLRHYYREISRYFLSQYPSGLSEAIKAEKAALIPLEMHSRDDAPVVIDLWLKGDFTKETTALRLRAQLQANKGKSIGVSHVIDPANERDILSYAAIFRNAFFESLRAHKPRIVLPSVDVTAGQIIDLDSKTS